MFIENMLSMCTGGDIHAFADHVYNFDNVAHLDSWCLEMLYELRVQIQKKYDDAQQAALEAAQKVKADIIAKEIEKKEQKRLEKLRKEIRAKLKK
jgi:hypothetical protein